MGIELFEETVNDCAQNCSIEQLGETKEFAICRYVEVPTGVTALDEAELLANAVFETLSIDSSTISNSKKRLNWPARMQIIKLDSGHKFLLDAAHNPSGLAKGQTAVGGSVQT